MLKRGHSIADYQIVTPLTENPCFETYHVEDPDGDSAKLVLIAAEQLVGKKTRQAFIDQSRLLLGHSFPGISCLVAADANEEYCYCLYPFPLGVPLAERLTEQFSARWSLEIVRMVATLLVPAHAAGFWHGAISPATIYLDSEVITLDQFSLASLLRLDFHSGIDPRYTSPELVRGEPLDAAADLYGLGIVLYRLLVGEVPFDAGDPFATAMLHVQEQPAPLPDPLSLLQPLIDGLICTVSSDRWTAERLISEIERYLQLPQIDHLITSVAKEVEIVEDVPQVDSEPTKIEKLMNVSDMATRVERRLRERAEVLLDSEPISPEAKRASTARMSAISQQSYRKQQDMNKNQYRQNSGMGRPILLIVAGVIVGVIIYLTLFGSQKALQQETSILPAALEVGLEEGNRQLQQGDVTAAEKTLEGLVEDYASYPQPYNNLAAIYARQGDLERSRNILERAMAINESYATIYHNLGTVYSEMARDSYGLALQLEQEGPQAVSLQLFGGTELVAVNTSVTKDLTVTDATEAVEKQPEPLVATQEEKNDAAAVETPDEKTVVATQAVNAEPVIEVVIAPEPEFAETFMQRWAAAWSAQDVSEYLSFYATEFKPSAGVSREAWAQQRETRLTRPKNIKVTLEDFVQVQQSGNRLQIEVTQSYKSDRYEDRTRKLFDLINVDNNWKIARERSLGRVR